jgi:hypothetical protein
MDTSGISAAQPVYGYMGNKIGTKVVSGGELFMDAAEESEGAKAKSLTTPANMRAAARYVNQGLSCDHAVDIVGKESMHMPDKVDIVKAGVKAIKKMSK